MSIHPELLAVMKEATYRPYTGQDAAGNNTYGAFQTVMCHREGPAKSMKTGAGDGGTTRTTEQRTVTLLADYRAPGIEPKGLITTFDGLTYTITDVKTVDDENGPYYQELTCSNNMER